LPTRPGHSSAWQGGAPPARARTWADELAEQATTLRVQRRARAALGSHVRRVAAADRLRQYKGVNSQQEQVTELGLHPLADLPPLRPTHTGGAAHAAHDSYYGVDHYGLHDATGHHPRRAPPPRAGAGADPTAAASSTSAVNAAVAAAAAATDRWGAWREAAASHQEPSSHPPPAVPPPAFPPPAVPPPAIPPPAPSAVLDDYLGILSTPSSPGPGPGDGPGPGGSQGGAQPHIAPPAPPRAAAAQPGELGRSLSERVHAGLSTPRQGAPRRASHVVHRSAAAPRTPRVPRLKPHYPGRPPPGAVGRGGAASESPDAFTLRVAGVVSSYLWAVLPARAAAAAAAAAAAGARHGGRQHGGRGAALLLSLRFVIESDSEGTPLQPEPLRQVCVTVCVCCVCAVCVCCVCVLCVCAVCVCCVRVCVCVLCVCCAVCVLCCVYAVGVHAVGVYVFEAATLCIGPATL
jgi:hypothetical protein